MLIKKKSIIVNNESNASGLPSVMVKAIVAIVILVIGSAVAYLVFKNAPTAAPVKKADNTITVKTISIQAQNITIPIDLSGLTEATDIRQISSNLSGSVIDLNPNLKKDAFIKKGQWLVKIKNEQLEPELNQAQAQLTAAHAAYNTALLTTQHNNAALLELGIIGTKNPPQLIEARARLDAAKRHLGFIQKRSGETQMLAPFDARILKRLVNIGDVITIGIPLAQTLSSNILKVRFPIPDSELQLLDKASFTQGAKLPISVHDSSEQNHWRAAIIDLEIGNALNNQFNYLVTEIYDPFNITTGATNTLALTVGSSVNSLINSKELTGVFKIPVAAVHNGNEIWVYDNNQLAIRYIDIIYRGAEFIYTDSTLKNGEQIIVSNINLPVDGMKLRKAQK